MKRFIEGEDRQQVTLQRRACATRPLDDSVAPMTTTRPRVQHTRKSKLFAHGLGHEQPPNGDHCLPHRSSFWRYLSRSACRLRPLVRSLLADRDLEFREFRHQAPVPKGHRASLLSQARLRVTAQAFLSSSMVSSAKSGSSPLHAAAPADVRRLASRKQCKATGAHSQRPPAADIRHERTDQERALHPVRMAASKPLRTRR